MINWTKNKINQTKKMLEEKHHYLFDVIIVVLVVIVVILVDFFVINTRSAPGEFTDSQNNQNNEISTIDESGLIEYLEGEKVFVPILNFHHIAKAPVGVSKITQSYYIEPAQFDEILTDLMDNGYQAVFVSEIVDLLERKLKPPDNIIAFTFDDGNINYYTNAWPILKKYNLKSSIYIMTGVGGKNYLNDDQIKELDQTGLVEIGSHTIYHPKLTKVLASERMHELEQSKEELEGLLNKEVNILAYPFGLYNDDIKKLSQALGYKAGLTFDQDAWQDPQDLMELNRISVYPNLNVVKFLDKLKNNK